MKIGFGSPKGGVGKTTLSFSIAYDLDYNLITNDRSNILFNYRKAKYYKNNIPLYDNTVYDFGGFEDENANKILEECDFVLVPTTPDSNSVMKSLEIIKKIKNKNIIVVANMIENSKDMNDIEQIMQYHFPGIEILYIRRGKLFKNALDSKISATQLYHKDNFNKHIYKNVFKDYLTLLKRLVEKN